MSQPDSTPALPSSLRALAYCGDSDRNHSEQHPLPYPEEWDIRCGYCEDGLRIAEAAYALGQQAQRSLDAPFMGHKDNCLAKFRISLTPEERDAGWKTSSKPCSCGLDKCGYTEAMKP
jgi:hypothetical protein